MRFDLSALFFLAPFVLGLVALLWRRRSPVRAVCALALPGTILALSSIVLLFVLPADALPVSGVLFDLALALTLVALVIRARHKPDPDTTRAPAQPLVPGMPAQTNTLAIVAFICAFLVWPAGLILGYVSLSQIRQTGEAGRGLALAAVIIGWILFAACVIGGIVLFTLYANQT